MRRSFLLAIAALLLGATLAASRMSAASGTREVDWPRPGGDIGKSHFSPLVEIDRENVRKLGLAWSFDLGTSRVQEATPVVVDGVVYTSGNLGRVYALDAASGRLLWTFTPAVDMQANRVACCDQANRGVAVAGNRVFVAALDGRLYALDARTGLIVWQTDTAVDRSHALTSTGAPEIAGELVVIGNGGSEYDIRGYVSAYHVRDGRLAWRWFVVPHDPAKGPQETPELERAVKTWSPNSRWDVGGGGAPWDAINYDPKFDSVIVGTGNGGPYSHAIRSPGGGDNLYLSSVVALDRQTGRLKWAYQETPQDSWDFTATQPMVLTDLPVAGRARAVILHAPKNGYMFVIDRRTGKPLDVNPLVATNWARGFDANGRAVLAPDRADYAQGPKIVFPASAGARNWYPAAWDAQRGLYFASMLDMGGLMFVPPGDTPHVPRALNANAALVFGPDLVAALPTLSPAVRAQVLALPEMKRVREQPYLSELRAIEPATGRTRWAVPMDGWQDRAGVLATASGLVFQGNLAGRFTARDADTGRLLKSIETGSSMLAAPMTYRIGNTQYVAIATGWGGAGWPTVPRYSAAYRYGNANRLLVFRLGGWAVTLPRPLPPLTVAPPPPAQARGVTPAVLARGRGLFLADCAICHANQPRSLAPDLRRMPPGTYAAFDEIVLRGALLPGGMPRWDDILAPADAAAIHAFLIDEQGRTRTHELFLSKMGKPLDTPAPVTRSSY